MAEQMIDESSSNSPTEEVTTETRNEIKAATDILDARKKQWKTSLQDARPLTFSLLLNIQPTAQSLQSSKVLAPIGKRVLGYGDIWKIQYGLSPSWVCV
jgi:gamma-glutamyl:cysteine ligase YbdK (ATP-grasp superfamily)